MKGLIERFLIGLIFSIFWVFTGIDYGLEWYLIIIGAIILLGVSYSIYKLGRE